VVPAWGERPFQSIRRADVANLLDEVQDAHGARQADAVLTVTRAVMNWHASRTDHYNPPVVKGMRRQSQHARRRARILTDDEIRAIWRAADSAGAFGGVVQFALLTAQRRTKVFRLRWPEIEGDVWTLPLAAREKGNAGVLVLPPLAMAVIQRQPRLAGNDFVFAGLRGPIRGLGKPKQRLDQASGVTSWVLHDLRRTARSLMARAGVSKERAERVMGHALPGIEGTYNRFEYRDAKAAALAKLAALVGNIIREEATSCLLR
jgi:integrase